MKTIKIFYKAFFLIFLFCLSIKNVYSQTSQNFITLWDLKIAGSISTRLSFGTTTDGTVNYTWQEVSPGSASGSGSWSGASLTINNLPSGSIIRLEIMPENFLSININSGMNRNRLMKVEQWGNVKWSTMQNSFAGCSNLQVTATDIPDLSRVTSMYSMFSDCVVLDSVANINSWNTSNVKSMERMFIRAEDFNQDISNWNTSSVTSMNAMFDQATSFNQNIGNWNTENVTNMSYMFRSSEAFNQNIGDWNTEKVTNMSDMFFGATKFNQDIGNWNTASVVNMEAMFYEVYNFNHDIGNWNTSSVTDMSSMFSGASSFNQDIGRWNTSKVLDMSSMFSRAVVFNQNLNSWQILNVKDMSSMFSGAKLFNQNLNNWNTSSVTDMGYMFAYADAFNGEIGNWDVKNVKDMYSMFQNTSNFNQNLSLWETSSVTVMRSMFKAAKKFNQDITTWNTSQVEDMSEMFSDTWVFNQNIKNWDTKNVKNMQAMFLFAVSFNQDLSSWNVEKVTNLINFVYNATKFNQNLGNWTLNGEVDLRNMLDNSGMDCSNYSSTLKAWGERLDVPLNRQLGSAGIKFGSNVVAIRNKLIVEKGWKITGDSPSNSSCEILTNIVDEKINNDLTVFPNPVNSELSIKCEQDIKSLNIYNCLGQLVLNTTQKSVSVSQLTSGLYYIQIDFDKSYIVKKFIKE